LLLNLSRFFSNKSYLFFIIYLVKIIDLQCFNQKKIEFSAKKVLFGNVLICRDLPGESGKKRSGKKNVARILQNVLLSARLPGGFMPNYFSTNM